MPGLFFEKPKEKQPFGQSSRSFCVWVLLLRPQQKKAKEQADLLKTLKAGDKVITSAGILGIITSVRDDAIIIRSADTKLELQKGAVSQILERGA